MTVYAASSHALSSKYFEVAARLGRALAEAGHPIVYGGGGTGLMGAMADAALEAGGEVHGVIPEFLTTLEKGHPGLTSMDVVPSMRIRKEKMLIDSAAVVTLPGGCGTFEEVFEAMTLKRLGQYFGPIVLVNADGYYDKLIEFLEHSVREKFMSQAHLDLWHTVERAEDVPDALETLEPWSADALKFASVDVDDAGASG
ncbi:TIGR00730 family Rossman fold protein [Wenzhouxiangella sp. XN79A]|uniref:TIGR00730 family Rossman fold protein n=1 Tax=Wenzhouxiangella sp. XN79A TaxID=2724193 RepID=UPI00144AC4B4|nr:TIGR00730 family Rossman fold protein [Wenzhouxiangella sp. XN79A]